MIPTVVIGENKVGRPLERERRVLVHWTRWRQRMALGSDLRDRSELDNHARHLMGDRNWFLLSTYGKLMAGPGSGRYVSALPAKQVKCMLQALEAGRRSLFI